MTYSNISPLYFNDIADSRYLYPSNPLIVNPELAMVLGLEGAIVVQQIKYWLNENQKHQKANTHFHEGKWWTYNSLKSWQETNFPFLKIDTLKRLFKRLTKDLRVLVTGNFNSDPRDRTLWYTIDYLQLNNLLRNALVKNAPIEDLNDLDNNLPDSCNPSKNALEQNAPMVKRKMPQCYTETNNQRLTEEENARTREEVIVNNFIKGDWKPLEATISKIKQKHVCSDEALQRSLQDFIKFYMNNKQERIDWDRAFECWCTNRKSWPLPKKIISPSSNYPLPPPKVEEKDPYIQQLFLKFLDGIKNLFDASIIEEWISHLQFHKLKDKSLIISVPSKFIRIWISDNYLEAIKDLIQNIDMTIEKIDFRIRDERVVV